MNVKRVVVALSFVIGMAAQSAVAHEDHRLNAVLADGPGALVQQYQHAQVYAQLGNLWKYLDDAERGAELFERSRKSAEAVEHPYVRDVLTGHLANEIASAGDFDRALQVLDAVGEREVWVKTAWKLVGKLSKAGQKDRAAALLKRAEQASHAEEDHELRAELISGTGASYRYIDSKQGENLVYESFGIAQMLVDPYDRAIMLNEVGAHMMDIGHRELAVDIFDRVDRLVESIKDPLQQAQALAMLGGEQAEKNERERAYQALVKARRIAQTLPEGEAKHAVMSEIARNFGQSHRFDAGIETADSIPDSYHRAEGYIRIAKNMYRVADKKQALALLEQTEALVPRIADGYQRAIVLRKLASEHITVGARDHARVLLRQAAEAIAPRG